MGNEWACPCVKREKVKYKADFYSSDIITSENGKNYIKINSFWVESVKTELLKSELDQKIKELLPVSVSANPLNNKEALVFYQSHQDIYSINYGFGYCIVKKRSIEEIDKTLLREYLEISINECITNSQQFLGAVLCDSTVYIVFFNKTTPDVSLGKVKVIEVSDLDKYALEKLLNESCMNFRSFLEYKSSKFIILQSQKKISNFGYYLYEIFDSPDNTGGIAQDLTVCIEEHIDNNLTFKGLLYSPFTFYLVFKVKDFYI